MRLLWELIETPRGTTTTSLPFFISCSNQMGYLETPFFLKSEEGIAQWPGMCTSSTPREPSRAYVIGKATEEQGY
jgi:hypothetical protein